MVRKTISFDSFCGAGTVGALAGVVSFMLATETSDMSVCDAVSACNHSASLHKSNAVFFFNCRLLTARTTNKPKMKFELFAFAALAVSPAFAGLLGGSHKKILVR